jgi:hypothetical protein
MQRHFAKFAVTALAPLFLTGCMFNSGYQPNATDMQLAVYAGKAAYPYDVKSEVNPHLFATVAPDATITLFNAGDESYSEFELWVNKSFTLHVAKLDARSNTPIAPKYLYNSHSDTLVNAPANTINTVQIYLPSTGKLWDVQGPIIPH